MQHGLSEVFNDSQQTASASTQTAVLQHGLLHNDSGDHASGSLRCSQKHLGEPGIALIEGGVDASSLGDRLRHLSAAEGTEQDRPRPPGQRIFEYENALTPSVPQHALGFRVIKRPETPSAGLLLSEFPNEILTHILSHLHPDSHASVALVSKRFYTLVTSPHAWRMAFQRFFPGQDAVTSEVSQVKKTWDDEDDDLVKSEVRHFTRLTPQASWRGEYLMRTRLLRSLARGKPGAGIGSSSRSSVTTKKGSAVLTYNTRLPSMVTNVHGSFTANGKKAPRVIHGASDCCVGSASDPTIGRLEKWGLDDPFGFAQYHEVVPHLLPYGVGEGPAAVPNVMDVSQSYGVIGGEGFPGGRVHFRPSNEYRGKYLDHDPDISNAHSDIPKIPELSEGISSVWIAKSACVPHATNSMVGMMAGSTLGVVSTYAVGHDQVGPRYANGEISARWVLSPGVPIISLKVDDSYSLKRKSSNRMWAVALNALGEVFYLTQPPLPPTNKSKTDDSLKLAWVTGRSTTWHLLEDTRREARPDEMGKNVIRGSYSPRSSSDVLGLSKDQLAAEAREIERFMHYKPAHFRKVCHGWDMRRRLEVDFGSDNGAGAGESVLVICCGLEDEQASSITRYCRTSGNRTPSNEMKRSVTPGDSTAESPPPNSIFGGEPAMSVHLGLKASERQLLPTSVSPDEWRSTVFVSKDLANNVITTSAIDMSSVAVATLHEDFIQATDTPSATPTGQASSDIPGRRARIIAVGTNSGKVVAWNIRQGHASAGITPLRSIQTESPEISALALSSLYLVHGGNDGLVQAWDPLASTLEPIRTLNSRSVARLPRQTTAHIPALRQSIYYSVGAIFLDADSTVLQGIVSFGTFVRYYCYSSSSQTGRRKRRPRHSDMSGRVAARRYGGGLKGYIAVETEELREEEEHKARQDAHLKVRFGVGLADLTEEEALQYAEMISQESLAVEEQRRQSASDTGSTADFDTTSTMDSIDTITPEPSITGHSGAVASSSKDIPTMNGTAEENDYELQIQKALRLSLLESQASDSPHSPPEHSSGDFEYTIAYKDKKGKSPAWPISFPESHTPILGSASWASTAAAPQFDFPRAMSQDHASDFTRPTAITNAVNQEDEDLALALKLSLAEEETRQSTIAAAAAVGAGVYEDADEFPALDQRVQGKGKDRAAFCRKKMAQRLVR